MKALKLVTIFIVLFTIFCALAAYPILQLVEWLPICPKNPQSMRDRECGYSVIWLWPLLTIVVSAFASALLCHGLLLGANERAAAEQSKKSAVS